MTALLSCVFHLFRPIAHTPHGVLVVMLLVVWGPSNSRAQNDLTDIPTPDPDAELRQMNVADGAVANLFAGDPAIRKPIQINFDATGQLWVASSATYPQIRPGEIASDQIVVLSDSDRDGQLDHHRVFADGLLIPTGVIPDGPNACYVAASTELLYLEDTDNDGVADERRVVFSGFGTEDTHHLLHTLRWGPDGCLYFNQSIYIHSHIDTAYGTRRLDGGGIWRYRPSTGELDVMAKGFINPWGHAFDAYGESFVTDGAFFEGINYAFPNSVFVTSPGATRWVAGMNPGSPKHCGLEILSGDHVPKAWQGELLTNDFRSHRVCRFSVKPNASGYVSRQQPELITSSNVAFRPIDVRMGPDGAVYVADWYNPIIQHGEVDFRDDRRDREHGRIWRVSFKDRAPDLWPEFEGLSTLELLASLEDSSLAVRQFARQELWRRGGDADVMVPVIANWRESASDETKSTRVLESLWLADAWQRSDLVPEPDAVLASASKRSLRPAIRSLWRLDRLNEGKSRITNLNPDNESALLEVIVANGENATSDSAAHLIDLLSARLDTIQSQPNLDFAMWQALRQTQTHWVAVDASDEDRWTHRESALAYAIDAVASHQAAELAIPLLNKSLSVSKTVDETLMSSVLRHGNADQLGGLLSTAMQTDETDSQANLLAMFVKETGNRVVPQNAETLIASRISSDSDILNSKAWREAIASSVATWKLSKLEAPLVAWFNQASDDDRSPLVSALGSFQTREAVQSIDRIAKSTGHPLQTLAMQSVAATRPSVVVQPLVDLLTSEQVPENATQILIATSQRKNVFAKLMKALRNAVSEDRRIDTDVARRLIRSVQTSGVDESLAGVLRELGRLQDASWKLTPEWSAKILKAAKAAGDPHRGQAIYRRSSLQCISCHAIGEGGGLVGPNLISLGGSSQPDYILESLIDPSAKLKEGFSTKKILTDEGEVITGIAIGESDGAIRLRLADGKEVSIDKETIEEELPGKSLMPAGLLDSVTESELVDLVAFMSATGRTPEFTVSTNPIVRTLETLNFTPQANRRLNRTSTDTVAKADAAMSWRPQTTLLDGKIPLGELDRFQQHRQTPPTSFVRFHVEMPSKGPLGVEFATEGIEAWIDGSPKPIWDLGSAVLPRGVHTIVLAIDRNTVKDDFAIKLTGEAIVRPAAR